MACEKKKKKEGGGRGGVSYRRSLISLMFDGFAVCEAAPSPNTNPFQLLNRLLEFFRFLSCFFFRRNLHPLFPRAVLMALGIFS